MHAAEPGGSPRIESSLLMRAVAARLLASWLLGRCRVWQITAGSWPPPGRCPPNGATGTLAASASFRLVLMNPRAIFFDPYRQVLL